MTTDTFTKIFWPIFASIVAGCFSLFTWYSGQVQERQNSLNKAIENATSSEGSPVRRVAGVWEINQFWDDQKYEQTVSATLTGALVGVGTHDGLYRCAAAEVIGNAIVGTESYSTGTQKQRSSRIAHILYGDRSGSLGLISELNRELRMGGQAEQPKTCETTTEITALDATREAIRKNWEYLREVNLNKTDLRGIPLYEADLDSALIMHADLRWANFRCANLHAANLSGSQLEGADLRWANISDLTPPGSQDFAKEHPEAVLLSSSAWESWRANNFRVDAHARPVIDARSNATTDSYPCSN